MSEYEEETPEAPDDDEQDPLVEGQQGKGYGEDEGEREDALPDD